MASRRRPPPQQDPEQARRLGRAVQVLRTELGLTRGDLAERSGLSYSYLSEIENGKKQASAKTLFVLADVLGVPPSELMAAAEQRIRSSPAAPRAPELASSRTRFASSPPENLDAARDELQSSQAAPSRDAGDEHEQGAPPARSRWFGSRPTRSDDRRRDDALRWQLDELSALIERLAPEDRELLLDFARRLDRR